MGGLERLEEGDSQSPLAFHMSSARRHPTRARPSPHTLSPDTVGSGLAVKGAASSLGQPQGVAYLRLGLGGSRWVSELGQGGRGNSGSIRASGTGEGPGGTTVVTAGAGGKT